MASYLQKLRRQSKQLIPQSEPKVAEQKPTEPSKVEESTAGPSEPVKSPPPPTVTEPTEEPAAEPVLDEEDQKFLERLAAIADEPEGEPPALPTRPVEVVDASGQKKVGRDAQEALLDGADKVALPMSPTETPANTSNKGKEKAKDGGLGRKKSVMSYFSLAKFNKKDKTKVGVTDKDRTQLADDLQSAVEASKTAELSEEQKENKELTDILDQLNLSAVNNRVFSFTKESEELLNKFTQVLKDLVNGVPTAYGDLEKLFTDYDNQLKTMYGNLPPFIQNLVKSLPAKLTATLGPELLAASAEKPGFDAKQAGVKSKKSKIPSVPSLKSLISVQGAVSAALRSILNFLKFRFPMLATGTNLIMSLAVLILLFVFWYCHKRGREVRLENERLAAEAAAVSSASSFNEDADSIFGDKKQAKPQATGEKEVPKSPLIIGDGKEEQSATVQDMPSVSHLPDPTEGKATEPVPAPVTK